VTALSDAELLTLLVSPGSRALPGDRVARRLLADCGSVRRIADRRPRELAEVPGVGLAKACRVLAALELGRRTLAPAEDGPPLLRPADVAARCARLAQDPVESFVAIAVNARNQGDGTIALWTMRTDGSGKQQITATYADLAPAWSPDGQTIAFERTGNTGSGINSDIYLVAAGGGGERPLVVLPYGQFSPAYSPDGQLLAFTSRDEEGVYQIFTVRVDATHLAQRTFGDHAHEVPTWMTR
jgi:Tol biopolymer transport system component